MLLTRKLPIFVFLNEVGGGRVRIVLVSELF